MLTALMDGDVVLTESDFVVGTSAGAIVGAQLTTGRPLTDLLAPIGAPVPWLTGGDDPGDSADRGEMLASRDPADAASEADWIAYFDFLSGAEWPPSFHCSAFSLDSGTPKLWDASSGTTASSGIELHHPPSSHRCRATARRGSTAAPETR